MISMKPRLKSSAESSEQGRVSGDFEGFGEFVLIVGGIGNMIENVTRVARVGTHELDERQRVWRRHRSVRRGRFRRH